MPGTKRAKVNETVDESFPYYVCNQLTQACPDVIPPTGHPAQHVLREIKDNHNLDFSEFLNTSSYVNVVSEKEELEVVVSMKFNSMSLLNK